MLKCRPIIPIATVATKIQCDNMNEWIAADVLPAIFFFEKSNSDIFADADF